MKSTKITDHIEETVSDEEELEVVSLPEQEAFFKMPKRFGTIPDVSEKPLGYGKGGYAHLYPHIKLPTQRLETISFGGRGEANKLYWGDNLHVMRTLPNDSIDLIYIDPPFFSGKNYNMIFQDQNEVMTFEDIWEGGIPTYSIWLNARLLEMKRLLKPTGSIYVHLDWHAVHYVKVEMDKIFGYENFRNQIIWTYGGKGLKNVKEHFARNYGSILFYRKTNAHLPNLKSGIVSESVKKRFGKYMKDDKIKFSALKNSGDLVELEKAKGSFIKKYSKEPSDDDVVRDYSEGSILKDTWDDIPIIRENFTYSEYLGYPTQKPEALLERIIKVGTKEGDVVADFFMGGGTTPSVAQRLGRRWIASDISRIAVEVTKGRILRLLKSEKGTQITLNKVPNIEVWSWGFYDAEKLQEATNEEFKDFVVRAYGGRPVANEYVNGSKNGIPILVGDKGSKNQVTKKEVLEFAQYIQNNYELNKTGTILGWSFSDSAIKAQEALANIGANIDFVKIKTVRIGSYEFIEDVIAKNKDYKNIFRFVFPPEVVLHINKKEDGEFNFDFSDSISLNNGKIINIQADFDFDGKFAPSEGYIFNPNTMILRYRFSTVGKRKIAFKVEDDQGGEKLIVKEV